MAVTVSVRMHAPVFTAGEQVTATITLSREALPFADHPIKRPNSALSNLQAVATKSNGLDSSSSVIRVPYIVVQAAGRWVSDRSWLRPAVHPTSKPLPPDSLDMYNPTGAPWDAALDDAFYAGYTRGYGITSGSGSGPSVQATGSFAAPTVPGHSGVVFRSAALLVCVDEPLAHGAKAAFDISCVLPQLIPATFRGSAMRYAYALIVVVGVPSSSGTPNVIRVPFRVVLRSEGYQKSDSGDRHQHSLPDATSYKNFEQNPDPGIGQAQHAPQALIPRDGVGTYPVIPVPTPRIKGSLRSKLFDDAPATALSMKSSRANRQPPTDIEFALAVNTNGRLTPYRTDEELWKNGSNGSNDNSLSLIRQIVPLTQVGDPGLSASPKLSNKSSVNSSVNPAGRGNSSLTPKYMALHGSPVTDFGKSLADMNRPQNPHEQPRNALPIYQISRGSKVLARLHLQKQIHYIGETITAVVDFMGSTGDHVYRLNARLECHEIIHSSYTIGSPRESGSGPGLVFRKVYGEHGEFVMLNHNTHVTFSIPHDAPVSFSTDVVQVRWLLKFVFLVPKTVQTKVPEPSDLVHPGILRGDSQIDTRAQQPGEKLSPKRNPVNLASDPYLREERVDAPRTGDANLPRHDTDYHSNAKFGDQLHNNDRRSLESEETPEWLGGDWRGNNESALFELLPSRETEVLHWTLPLTVTCREGSHWGLRSYSQMRLCD